MRNFVMAASAIVLFVMMTVPAAAEPTIFGPTGLIVNPTADVTTVEHAWIALNFLDNDDNSIWTANVTGAISDEFEIGVGAVHPEEGDDGISFCLKWLFMQETEEMPGAAAGITVTDAAGENTTMFYVVASKFFYLSDNATENASLHGGISMLSGDNDDQLEFFGGIDVEVMQDLILIAEYNTSEDSFYEGLTYGVRYYFGPQLTGQAGFLDGNLHLGASFVF